ncbi:hypothetical protein FSW04_05460 [Baekduia soli]|uniref:Uncharacterized protein n=1 Tax=Baekduia soli TaxID=496014 RepID=A0A5B8U2A6_9ACTN|nr:hypothetical protein [Baekduia soli]QEC47088.1 hypothetical protein FSW04_05460 [Baekduia soli]
MPRWATVVILAALLVAGGVVALLVERGGSGGTGRAAGPRPPTTTAAASRPGPGTVLAGCPVLPADNAFNRDVSRAPVDPRSAVWLRSIGLDGHLHAGFASTFHGIPFTIVGPGRRRVPIRFDAYGYESDPGPYPIPLDAPVERGTGDRHVIVLQRGTCRLYELFGARRTHEGWLASSGATWDLRSNALRPKGWTSADAAGLPILPGLARAGEVATGRITHALRFTTPRTQRAYVAPARHLATPDTDPDLPPMGLRVRLKAGYPLAGFHGQAKVILQALKTYGLILADNGPAWHVTGAPDPRWDDADLRQLDRVRGSAFEAVQSGPLTTG